MTPRIAKVSLVIYVVALALFQLVAIAGPVSKLIAIDSVFAVLSVLNVGVLSLCARTRLYITDLRILRTCNLRVWRKTLQLPLDAVDQVKVKGSRNKPTRSYVEFIASSGKRIVFSPIMDDPDTAVNVSGERQGLVIGIL